MTARTGQRRCAYCRDELDPERRKDAEYCDSSCRARASEKRAAGRPVRGRRRSAQKRSRAAQTRRRPGLRISYRRAVAAVAVEISGKGSYPASFESCEAIAGRVLSKLLTDRQRATL